MNFIVFDLEWNNAGYENRVDEQIKQSLPFEIIEIGAVKFDAGLGEIGRFSELVRPVYYRRLTRYVKKVTSRTQASLKEGAPFKEVASRFFDFVGDGILCSWSTSDPQVLRQNTEFFGCDRPGSWRTLDLQRYYALKVEGGDIREQRSVAHALEKLGIGDDDDLHTALGDAAAEGEILKLIGAFDLADFVSELPDAKRYTSALSIAEMKEQEQKRQLNELVSACPACGRKLLTDRPFRGNKRKKKRVAACNLHGLIRQSVFLFPDDTKATLQQDFLFQGAKFLGTEPKYMPAVSGDPEGKKTEEATEKTTEKSE